MANNMLHPTPGASGPGESACARFREALLDSVGGEPLPAEIEAHVRGCGACTRLRSEVGRALDILGSLPAERVPAGFPARVAAAAHREARFGRRAPWIAAAAAALVLATGAWFVTRPGTPGVEIPVAHAPAGDAEPPDELVENLDLFQEMDLARDMEDLEALSGVEAADEFPDLVRGG